MDLDETEYSHEYLLECRQSLIHKVRKYRADIERQSSDKARLVLKHHKELEHIRKFYQTIAYATTRTGKIVKKSYSSAAAEVMKEIGLQYTMTQS